MLKARLLKQDKRLAIYLVCIGIATVFWFLNALSKKYTVDLSFPVRYTNLPKDKILVNSPPDDFIVQVNSYGFTLLRHKLSLSFAPLVFNVNDFIKNESASINKRRFSVSLEGNKEHFIDQLSSELTVLRIRPDSVFFVFDQVVSKKVKVHADVKVELKKQFQLSGEIGTKPDSVTVKGPLSILDTLSYVSTRFQDFKSVSEAIQRNVSLLEYDNLMIENKRIVLNIPIEEYTETQVLVPVTVENIPDSISVKLFPQKVKVSYWVGLSRYAEILPEDFKFVVNWNEIQNGTGRLKVKERAIPPFVKSVKITPEELEYLIEK